jgi:hypothetical protein
MTQSMVLRAAQDGSSDLSAYQRAHYYVGTFSKSTFADIRLGYVVVPKGYVDVFAQAQRQARHDLKQIVGDVGRGGRAAGDGVVGMTRQRDRGRAGQGDCGVFARSLQNAPRI